MKDIHLRRASTLFLKAALILLSTLALAICVFTFPAMWSVRDVAVLRFVFYPALLGFHGTLVPFLFAMYQAFKLLHYIDRNNAFSQCSVQALMNIKYCALAMSVLYAAGMPMVYVFAELDDAPGAILMGGAIVVAPLIVATFAAVLQKLIQSAVDMKTENDLTV